MDTLITLASEMAPGDLTDRVFEVEDLGSPGASQLPLVVALNRCLLKSDTSFERLAAAATRNPLTILLALANLLRRRPAYNERPALSGELDIDVLPTQKDLVHWLSVQRGYGREITLLTSGDEEIADSIARRSKVFDRVKAINGRDPEQCLKLHYLEQKFPNGFVYVGGRREDLKIWSRSAGVVLCATPPNIARHARNLGKPVEIEFPRDRRPVDAWISAIRLHQWVKNLLIFAPALLGNVLTDPAVLTRCVFGFVLLGIVASSNYMLNDLLDLRADRHHWLKRARPLAAGDINLAYGLVLPPLGIVFGLLAASALSPSFAILLATYSALALSYSMVFKRRPILDVFVLATLYVLRLVMGIVLAGTTFSPWLLCFAMFFFFSLAIAKRHAEIRGSDEHNSAALSSRGYQTSDEALTLSLGVSSAVASLVIMILYLTQEVFQQPLYSNPGFLWAVAFGLAIWLGRIWFLVHRGRMHDDPVHFALHDPASLFLGSISLLAFALAIL